MYVKIYKRLDNLPSKTRGMMLCTTVTSILLVHSLPVTVLVLLRILCNSLLESMRACRANLDARLQRYISRPPRSLLAAGSAGAGAPPPRDTQ